MQNNRSIVICKLPKAGLGNKLFPLMRAYTFGHLNNLPVTVTHYHHLKIGPWLRHEKNKRKYNGFFSFQKGWIAAQMDNWRIKNYRKGQKREPELVRVEDKKNLAKSYLFSAIPHYAHRFDGLKENRQLVLQLLWNVITPAIKEKVGRLSPPCIGVHIRMGDFRRLKDGEEFGKTGTVRTPEDYFVNSIHSIRKLHGSDLPVSIFTDGTKNELIKIFTLNNIHLVEGNNDLVDLIVLSRSKVIVTSAGSTFSYWAGFISDAAVIMHPSYADLKIRSESDRKALYEGAFDDNNEQLRSWIQTIR
jgi:hypothetical protein